MVHSFITTPVNDHNLKQLPAVIHGEEAFFCVDSGYRGVEKRKEARDRKADWLVAEMQSKINSWKKPPYINKQALRTEYLKASKVVAKSNC